jgi:hypothetical protein
LILMIDSFLSAVRPPCCLGMTGMREPRAWDRVTTSARRDNHIQS